MLLLPAISASNSAADSRVRLRWVAAVSGVYDAIVGVTMLAGRPLLAQVFSVALPTPPVHADLNGVFLLSIASGYLIPYRHPDSAGGVMSRSPCTMKTFDPVASHNSSRVLAKMASLAPCCWAYASARTLSA